jgi:hypothetical protein
MHLHGHNFYVLHEGPGRWDGTIVRPSNPHRRDVHLVRAGGHLAIQFDGAPGTLFRPLPLQPFPFPPMPFPTIFHTPPLTILPLPPPFLPTPPPYPPANPTTTTTNPPKKKK